jgi:hypothetical protein
LSGARTASAVALAALVAMLAGCRAGPGDQQPASPDAIDVGDTTAATGPDSGDAPATAAGSSSLPGGGVAIDPGAAGEAALPTAAGATAIVGDVGTYSDTVLGYSIDYPAGWFVQSWQAGQAVVITSYDPSGAPGRGGVPADAAKVDVMPFDGATAPDLDALVEVVAQTATTVIADEPVTLPSGAAARRLTLADPTGGETPVLLTFVGGQPIGIFGYGDTSSFDVVARSLR